MDIALQVLTTGWNEFWSAWHAWFSGPAPELPLWGWKVLWWGRIGKCMELVATLVFAGDYIGPDGALPVRGFMACFQRTEKSRPSLPRS